MAINITTWSPDTCKCVVEYAWDDTSPQETRVHSHNKTVKTCPAHTGIVGPALFNLLLRENQSKNMMLHESVKAVSKLRKPNNDANINDLADGVEYVYSFSGSGDSRILSVKFNGANLNALDNVSLRAAAAKQQIPVVIE